MLDGPEIPESPEVKHRVRGRRIGKGKIPQSGMRWKEGRRAHCGARSKRKVSGN